MSERASPSILEVRDVFAGYADEDILHGVSIDVPRNGIAAVIGPNGSGKSTLLKTIYGLVPNRRGSVRLVESDSTVHDLMGLRPHEVSMHRVNMVPQLQNVFPEMSVVENLEIGARPLGRLPAGQMDKILTWFPMLRGKLRKRAATLSGGQRQMLGIARALMSDPTLLILDEPSAGLSPAVVEEVFQKVKAINADGVSVLMVEQKARQCLAIADIGYVLDQGHNRLTGTGSELLANKEVIQLYLGGGRRLGIEALVRRSEKVFDANGSAVDDGPRQP